MQVTTHFINENIQTQKSVSVKGSLHWWAFLLHCHNSNDPIMFRLQLCCTGYRYCLLLRWVLGRSFVPKIHYAAKPRTDGSRLKKIVLNFKRFLKIVQLCPLSLISVVLSLKTKFHIHSLCHTKATKIIFVAIKRPRVGIWGSDSKTREISGYIIP